MTTKSQRYFWIVFLAVFAIALTACTPAITSSPTETSTPTAVFTFVPPTTIPATVMPTQAPPPIFTPDAIQVDRWQEYQMELARVVLSSNQELGNDPAIYKDALCEWDILGQSSQEIQEVYVYAACIIAKGNGDMRSLAIIYLEPDGSIRQVKLPEPKKTISFELDFDPFPLDVRENSATILNSNPLSAL